ncbi:MAG: hypothetical protein ACYC35_06355 [Pirellulales bacterium]
MESADAFQQVCDKAMPALLKGDKRGFDSLLGIAHPQLATLKESLIYRFQTDFERRRQECGDPVDWKHVGAKKIGSALRQYIYICRYKKLLISWSFTAQEANGRWSFVACRWEYGAMSILSSLRSSDQATSETCLRFCGGIVDLLAHGKSEAGDAIQKSCVLQDPASRASMSEASGRFLAAVASSGNVLKCELVGAKDIGGAVGEYCYLIAWERGTTLVHFYAYRSDENWRLVGFVWEGEMNSMFSRVAMESSTFPDAPPRTAGNPVIETNTKSR